jgi:DNA polymerase III delta prime subunit
MSTSALTATIDPRHERIDVRLKRAIESGTMPRELLICGPAGTGKTYPILAVFHTLLMDNPGLRMLILRMTRVSLSESALVTFEQEILPADGCIALADGPQRSNRRSYRYPNGSELVVGGLDRNPTRILSTAWDIVFINEGIEMAQDSWETLASRMDRPGRDRRFGYLIADTNPAHPSHWLKTRCDSGASTIWNTTHEANPLLYDGRDWTPAGLRYLARLDKLTGPRRKRLRDGLWAQGDGLWFETFDPEIHVDAVRADFHRGLKTYIGLDSGVWTGAVWLQVREQPTVQVTVFDCYLTENVTAEKNARAIRAHTLEKEYGPIARVFTDPAGGAKNPVGPTVFAEYERAGLVPLDRWPLRAVADSLELVNSYLGGDGNPPALFIHPRCIKLIDAMVSYHRAKRAGQIMDWPEDPQHPAEEMIDSLRGVMCALFPDGRKPPPSLRGIHAGWLH